MGRSGEAATATTNTHGPNVVKLPSHWRRDLETLLFLFLLGCSALFAATAVIWIVRLLERMIRYG